jgi:hypothetical protein
VIATLRQHEGRSSGPNGFDDIVANEPVPPIVPYDRRAKGLKLHPRVRLRDLSRHETRRPNDHTVPERPECSLNLRIDSMPDRSALHEDDGMMPVLSGNCGGQPQDEPGLRASRNLLEAASGQVMTFVDDQVTVAADTVVDEPFTNKTLNDRHVDSACRLVSASTDSADLRPFQVQKRRQPFDPLIEELTTMHEHQRAHATLSNQPGRDYCLAERRGCRKYTCFMRQQRITGPLLIGAKLAVRLDVQSLSDDAFIPDRERNLECIQELPEVIQAPAGQTNMRRVLLCARDHSRLAIR